MSTDLDSALNMKHLDVPDEDLREQALKAVETPTEEASSNEPDPRDNEEWTFQFSWTDNRGKTWAGAFTSKILTLGDTQAVANLQSRFAGGAPWESLTPDARAMNLMIAQLTFALTKRPTWAESLRELHDPMIVYQLFERVVSHETRYFRRPTLASGSSE